MSLTVITSVPIESEEWVYFDDLDVRGYIDLFDGGEYEDGELICFTVYKEDWPGVEKLLRNKIPSVTLHCMLEQL